MKKISKSEFQNIKRIVLFDDKYNEIQAKVLKMSTNNSGYPVFVLDFAERGIKNLSVEEIIQNQRRQIERIDHDLLLLAGVQVLHSISPAAGFGKYANGFDERELSQKKELIRNRIHWFEQYLEYLRAGIVRINDYSKKSRKEIPLFEAATIFFERKKREGAQKSQISICRDILEEFTIEGRLDYKPDVLANYCQKMKDAFEPRRKSELS